MSNLTLDGSTSFIGTEFIKLLATGSSKSSYRGVCR